ncbi:MAG: hypothetical protein JXR78_11970 [Victivallales bacterium]|nr:hypothetical protein [Victivallales bacterium]
MMLTNCHAKYFAHELTRTGGRGQSTLSFRGEPALTKTPLPPINMFYS